jgi:peptide-methionine (S)-S-oxide reductase
LLFTHVNVANKVFKILFKFIIEFGGVSVKEIILAGGCFWGVEAYFKKIKGVLNTKVGYVNGLTDNPTYEEVCSSKTGYAEACYIEYDENYLKLNELLGAFWKIIDPIAINRQGHDIGNQYRTGVYYLEDIDIPVITEARDKIQEKYEKPVVTEIEEVKNFYEAEEYHQGYLDKNPGGYCHIPRELLEE